MKDYSADMDYKAQRLAALTNIAAGWMKDDPVFKIGCNACQFECGGIVTPWLIKVYGDQAGNRVENDVWVRFRRDAEMCKCKHLSSYDFFQSNPEMLSA